MRYVTVKTRITVWLTLLMSLLAVLMLTFTLSISSGVTFQTCMSQLSHTVLHNSRQIAFQNGRLKLNDDFQFYQYGVSTLVYSQSESLLAGQLPVSFPAREPFQNGLTRTVAVGEDEYLVLDICYSDSWEEGVWLRGLMEVPRSRQFSKNLLLAMLIALPLFLVLATLGSYWIARQAFRPLDSIAETAEAINEASDLSRRIGLPSGRDEFTRLAATFDHLFERLERSFEAEKQFTADASHELRTPVSIIKGACEYASKYDETPEERQETITMISRQAVKMSALISQLLSMTRLDQGTELNQFEPVNLASLLQNLCEEQAYPHGQLTLELQDLTVCANPALLTRLVHNLVENAFKYGRPGGHVWIRTCREGSEVLLQVRDNGIGIAPEQQDRVWQRFYQADAARSKDTGAGLGLSMVQQIARIHGGYMTLESIPGAGSAFTLHLPDSRQKNCTASARPKINKNA